MPKYSFKRFNSDVSSLVTLGNSQLTLVTVLGSISLTESTSSENCSQCTSCNPVGTTNTIPFSSIVNMWLQKYKQKSSIKTSHEHFQHSSQYLMVRGVWMTPLPPWPKTREGPLLTDEKPSNLGANATSSVNESAYCSQSCTKVAWK